MVSLGSDLHRDISKLELATQSMSLLPSVENHQYQGRPLGWTLRALPYPSNTHNRKICLSHGIERDINVPLLLTLR